MSLIWRKANGDIRMAASGVPELVRVWSYRKMLSDCENGSPSGITIIGCDPPDCVRYKNTNVNNEWWEYVRGGCGTWSGSGGYAWPADIPDCPFPDGISIEETECTYEDDEDHPGRLLQLKVTKIGASLKGAWAVNCDNGPDQWKEGCYSYDEPGTPDDIWCRDTYPGWWYVCSMDPFGDETEINIGRNWEWNPPGVWYPRGLRIGCDGSVTWYGHAACDAGAFPEYQTAESNGTPISLDGEGLPIGNSTIAMNGRINGDCGCGGGGGCEGSIGTLTIAISKV